MKSKARRAIERSIQGNMTAPKMYLAPGYVFMYPSSSGESSHHIVARLTRETAHNTYIEWVCSCKGFYNSEHDSCWHIADLKRQYAESVRSLIRGEAQA